MQFYNWREIIHVRQFNRSVVLALRMYTRVAGQLYYTLRCGKLATPRTTGLYRIVLRCMEI